MAIIFFLNIFIIFYISRILFKKNITPFSIFLQIFNLCYLLLSLTEGIKKINYYTDKIIFISIISYIIGMLICKLKVKKINYADINLNKLKKIIYLLCFFSFIGFFYYIYYLESRIGIKAIINNPTLLNKKIAEHEINLGIFGYLKLLSIPNTLFISYFIIKVSKKNYLMYIIFLSQLLINISTKRSELIEIILLNIFLYLYLKKINFKFFIKLFGVIILFLGFFILVQNKLNKELNYEVFFIGKNIGKEFQTVLIYFIGNLPSMEELLKINYLDSVKGEATFRILNKILNKIFDLNIKETYVLMEFVNIPMPFNTAPMQYYIYRDFGIMGSILFFILCGYFTTKKFLKYLNGNESLIFEIAIISSFLLQSIRAYNIIYLNFWINLLVIKLVVKYTKNHINRS